MIHCDCFSTLPFLPVQRNVEFQRGGKRISCFPWNLPSASRSALRIIWSVFKTDLSSRREWNTFNWLLSFTFLVCLLPLLGSTHAARGVCREEALSNNGSERLGDNSRAPSCAFSTLSAQICSSIWDSCSSLLVYFKEPTCSAQTSSLGEWREPVTAARAVLAVAICMVFSPSHFLQLSTCFPCEIEKGQLSLFSREEAVVGCEMARGMKPFTLSGAKSHILISAVCKPISSTGKTQRLAKSWSCSQARPPWEKTGNIWGRKGYLVGSVTVSCNGGRGVQWQGQGFWGRL